MKAMIDRILDDGFQKGTGVLAFSCSVIEIDLEAETEYEGTFEIYGPEHQLTEGSVYVNGIDMECVTREFTGSISEIAFCFHGRNMKEKEIRQGEFLVVSNQGEYIIPYRVSLAAGEITSSMGAIKNLFHFTNLAKSNWEEAVCLFYSERFWKILRGTDWQYASLYKGLSGIYDHKRYEGGRNGQNVDAFLQAIKKKQPVEYLLSEKEIHMNAPGQLSEYVLTISRNGWGHTYLKIETEGNFLSIDKEVLREEDFLGNHCQFRYYISAKKLHAGANTGTIRLSNSNTDITLPVVVMNRIGQVKRKALRQEQKHDVLKLMEYYTAFRSKKISVAAWRKETSHLVDQMIFSNENDIAPRLFCAQLLITEGRIHEASGILKQAGTLLRNRDDDDEAIECYYRYLTALASGEDTYIKKVTEQMEQSYFRNDGNWRIAWLWMYLQEDYEKNPARKWRLLEEQFMKGCTSPVVYLEGLHLLHQYPSLLIKMEAFEIHLIWFSAKKQILPLELIGQIVYLISRSKEYSRLLFQILLACYQKHPDDETIRAICSLLIKGNKIGASYLFWYRLGIEREIRVTRLFEYFLMSVNPEKEEKIPKMVLMYFSYNSELDYRCRSYLYVYIHVHQTEFPELYASYEVPIKRFIEQQLLIGHINKWLAYLYQNCIPQSMITEEIANGLAEVLFMAQVDLVKNGIRELIVIYEKGNSESVFPVTGQQVFIPLYGEDYRIFLVDLQGNRHVSEETCRVERLMRPDELIGMITGLVTGQLGLDIWQCVKRGEIEAVTDDNAEAMVRLLESEWLEESYCKEIRYRLIRFYYDRDHTARLDRYLETLTADQVADKNRGEILKLLVRRYMHSQAYEWIKDTDCRDMDARIVLRILNGVMDQDKMSGDRTMLMLAYTAFTAGKYDEGLLSYLSRYFTGSVKQMRNIWKAAREFGLDTYNLSERLLVRMLYSSTFVGEQPEIFHDYVMGGGQGAIIKRVMVECALEYFINDKVMDIYMIRQIEKEVAHMAGGGEELDLSCRLAYIKYFAEHRDEWLGERQRSDLIGFVVKQCISKNLSFAFYKDFVGYLPFMWQFLDKTMIEYKARRGNKVVIHYLLEQEGGHGGEYIREEMKDMFGGVCTKQFVLFFGDRLSYYIAEQEDGKEQFTESASIGGSETVDEQGESKFSQINDIEVARTLGDYETVDSILNQYYREDFLAEQLFHLI